MKNMISNILSRYKKEEAGATAIEYGLIVALISVAIITIIFLIGEDIEGLFLTILGYIESA